MGSYAVLADDAPSRVLQLSTDLLRQSPQCTSLLPSGFMVFFPLVKTFDGLPEWSAVCVPKVPRGVSPAVQLSHVVHEVLGNHMNEISNTHFQMMHQFAFQQGIMEKAAVLNRANRSEFASLHRPSTVHAQAPQYVHVRYPT